MACWKNYKQIGMKKKGNRLVPNCVPKKANTGVAVNLKKEKFKKQKPEGTKSGSTRPKNMTPKGHLVGDAYGHRGKMDYVPTKRFLVGGLLTAGIKYGFKQYKKAGGRKIIEIMKSGVRGAGKRSDAKTDLAYGIKMHGGNKLTKRDLAKLYRAAYK
tara:strand:- start:2436 stop:2906 length:471 start_codon:yes stop_codon:yes gene_type:complete